LARRTDAELLANCLTTLGTTIAATVTADAPGLTIDDLVDLDLSYTAGGRSRAITASGLL
jgi:hypothetical protein